MLETTCKSTLSVQSLLGPPSKKVGRATKNLGETPYSSSLPVPQSLENKTPYIYIQEHDEDSFC